MTNVLFLPGVPLPIHQVAERDARVAAVLDDLSAGRLGLNRHEAQGAWPAADVARLHAVLDDILGAPADRVHPEPAARQDTP